MMKKNEPVIQEIFKKEYFPPVVEVTYVEMEQGIAANSAVVSPVDPANNQIIEQWDTNTDATGDYDW